MKSKIIAIIATIFSSIVTILWILGLIFADINLFILAMIVLIISIFPAIKYYSKISEFFRDRNSEIVDNEKTQRIKEKASFHAFTAVIVVSIYSVIAVLTLRNIYPAHTDLTYPFVIITVTGLVVYIISSAYYKKIY
jgi:uncharacterized membrane protein